MQITDRTRVVLAPLAEHKSQIRNWEHGDYQNHPQIGVYMTSNPNCPIITHAEFAERVVLPALEEACERFGQENVAQDIVNMTTLLYAKEGQADWPYPYVDSFLNTAVLGDNGENSIPPNLQNAELAAKYGVNYVYEPIVKLGLVHRETLVFDSVAKFFNHHACRLGWLIDDYGEADYHSYMNLCEYLLRHNIYDWSLEQSPEEWGMLRPSIKRYGMHEVLEPMVQAMIQIGIVPGTKERKYKHSFLSRAIRALYPLMMPQVRKDGPTAIVKMLQPIVDFVHDLNKEGAFLECHESISFDFFDSFKDGLPLIKESGVPAYLSHNKRMWRKRFGLHV